MAALGFSDCHSELRKSHEDAVFNTGIEQSYIIDMTSFEILCWRSERLTFRSREGMVDVVDLHCVLWGAMYWLGGLLCRCVA